MSTSQSCISHETWESSDTINVAEFCTHYGDDDCDLEAPSFDEFDMWEKQQAVGQGCPGSKMELISNFQKFFLEELNKDHDTNRAAANALQRFYSSPPLVHHSETPEINAVTFMSMSDEDEQTNDHDLDEFDLWQCRQDSEVAPRSEQQNEAIASFQKIFLEELAGADDRAGAAANALIRFLPTRQGASTGMPNMAETQSPTAPSGNDTMKQRAAKSLQAFYVEELDKCGDANLAAIAAFRRLSKPMRRPNKLPKGSPQSGRSEALRALKNMMAKEFANEGDINGAVAGALLRLRAAGNKSSETSHGPNCDSAGPVVMVGASS